MLSLSYNISKIEYSPAQLTKKIVRKWVETTDRVNKEYPESGNILMMGRSNVLYIMSLCKACDWKSLYTSFFEEYFPHQKIKIKRTTYDEIYANEFVSRAKNFKLPGRFSSLSAFSRDSDITLINEFIEEKFKLEKSISFFIQDVQNMVKNEDHTSFPFKNSHYQITLDYYSTLDNQREQFRNQQNQLQAKVEKHPSYQGSYINYLNGAIRSETIYYKENTEKLKKIKKKYDPTNLFHRPQSYER